MMMRNRSSVVRMGWTWLRSPRWSATAWLRNEAIMKARPINHTPRLRAWVSKLRRSVESSEASSTPIR